jgi:SAM-dependent methyltransferase
MSALGDFGPHADAYRARPTYPAELVDGLCSDAGARAGDAVADVGAGTGIFTALLVERGFSVTAVEPNPAMRARAPEMNVRWLAGSFDATGLEDGSQRWVTAAQAFHWARPATALPELRRVLGPGGALTVLWNDRESDRDPLVAWTAALIKTLVPDFDEAYRNKPWAEILATGGSFGDVVAREHRHTVTMSRARYVDLWRSHNRLAVEAGPKRLARFFAALDDHLDRESVAEVHVPYMSRAWTARRR